MSKSCRYWWDTLPNDQMVFLVREVFAMAGVSAKEIRVNISNQEIEKLYSSRHLLKP